MSEIKVTRLSKIARELNVGISTIVDFLHKKGIKIDTNPNTKVTPEQYELLLQEYSNDLSVKKESERLNLRHLKEKHETVTLNDMSEEGESENQDFDEVLIKDSSSTVSTFETETEKEIERGEHIKLNILGKINLEKKEKKKPEKQEEPKVPEPVIVPEPEELKPVEEENIVEEIPGPEEFEEEPEETELPEEIIPADEVDIIRHEKKELEVKVIGKIDLDSMNQRTRPPRKTKEQKESERKARIASRYKEGSALKPGEEGAGPETSEAAGYKPKLVKGTHITEEKEDSSDTSDPKKKRKRIKKEKERVRLDDGKTDRKSEEGKDKFKKKKLKKGYKPEVSEDEVDKQIKDTMSRLAPKGKSKGSKYRREKREIISQKMQAEEEKRLQDINILKVTEFISVSELANMMKVPVTDVISTCMNMGLFVSINQRLDAETMALVADEFNFKVEFVSVELQESIREEEDKEEQLEPRPPIVTVMGHVDHGKTKLLDHIRNTNVIAGEAGGITQHIGAYNVELANGRKITFLDTPGHEAFTAMRARGAQITDVAIIVVAADDGVMPQTIEAINHAQAAGVPMVFAINKIDKPEANPEKIKEALANMNILVEDWGGKYQSHEISAKNGLYVEDLLEKVLLEAELLELKANPNKHATGTVIESSLDKGRGYIATILVQAGTLYIGDMVLAGTHTGKVKAMFNERGKKIDEAGPSTPVMILGLDGAPQAGDKFNVMENEREAKEIATKRNLLQREQGLRSQKHITLDEIGRRIAIGNFQELNVIVKGDVDGSVEALSDSLIKLSTDEIQVNIIHKAVGQISEGDVLLAAASNAIIVGFQVRPSMQARRLAEKEEIEIRLYSIIYNAINEVKSAMEGMLSPEIREDIVATLEVVETFKITKVGTIAGCMVKEGKIKRDTRVRVIREGIVVYTGELGSLKRFKDDAREVLSGLECGLNIANFNDIKVGDIIEGYEIKEIKKKL
ncbi:MAG: translation initiation factor IF-2 [Bacteroidales bacterium]|nr:translation initiation factor IF-2 [Bacteroidales bacterium]